MNEDDLKPEHRQLRERIAALRWPMLRMLPGLVPLLNAARDALTVCPRKSCAYCEHQARAEDSKVREVPKSADE